jgi:hypothetical protein
MKRSTARWTTAIAAAALIGLPAAGFAQATPQTPPSQTSPAQTTPAPTATQGQTSSSATSAADHVREAKQALASVPPSSVPASSRGKLSQLKSHLDKLERLVASGDQAATSGSSSASGTSAKKGAAANWGSEAATIDKLVSEVTAETTDDTAKQSLMEVRRHITELAGSMSGTPKDQSSAAPSSASPDTMGANPSASQQSTPSAAAATPTPSATDPSAAGASPNPSSTMSPSSPSAQSSTTSPSNPDQSTQPGAAPQAQPAPGQVDAQAAKQHLSEARDSLAQLTSLPEASKLQGDARTQVSQLISNFNELITTQSDWKSAYAKVSANLDMLIGPDASATGMSGTTATPPATAGTTGAAGATGPAMQIDPAIKGKLQEFRTHLKEFEQSAGGVNVPASASASQTPGAMAPSANPSSTANPSNPTSPSPSSPSATSPSQTAPEPTNAPMPTGTSGTSGVPGAAGTSGTAAPAPTDDQSKPSASPASERAGHSEADKHLDAIQDILNKSKDGKLDKSQTDEIKTHLEQLRQLLGQTK